jgi:hypothetical protein
MSQKIKKIREVLEGLEKIKNSQPSFELQKAKIKESEDFAYLQILAGFEDTVINGIFLGNEGQETKIQQSIKIFKAFENLTDDSSDENTLIELFNNFKIQLTFNGSSSDSAKNSFAYFNNFAPAKKISSLSDVVDKQYLWLKSHNTLGEAVNFGLIKKHGKVFFLDRKNSPLEYQAIEEIKLVMNIDNATNIEVEFADPLCEVIAPQISSEEDKSFLNNIIHKIQRGEQPNNKERTILLAVKHIFSDVTGVVPNHHSYPINLSENDMIDLLKFLMSGNKNEIQNQDFRLCLYTAKSDDLKKIKSIFGDGNSLVHELFQASSFEDYVKPDSIKISIQEVNLQATKEKDYGDVKNGKKYLLCDVGAGGHYCGLVFDKVGADGSLTVYVQDSTSKNNAQENIELYDTYKKLINVVYPQISSQKIKIVKTITRDRVNGARAELFPDSNGKGCESECRYSAVVFSKRILENLQNNQKPTEYSTKYKTKDFEDQFAKWYDESLAKKASNIVVQRNIIAPAQPPRNQNIKQDSEWLATDWNETENDLWVNEQSKKDQYKDAGHIASKITITKKYNNFSNKGLEDVAEKFPLYQQVQGDGFCGLHAGIIASLVKCVDDRYYFDNLKTRLNEWKENITEEYKSGVNEVINSLPENLTYQGLYQLTSVSGEKNISRVLAKALYANFDVENNYLAEEEDKQNKTKFKNDKIYPKDISAGLMSAILDPISPFVVEILPSQTAIIEEPKRNKIYIIHKDGHYNIFYSKLDYNSEDNVYIDNTNSILINVANYDDYQQKYTKFNKIALKLKNIKKIVIIWTFIYNVKSKTKFIPIIISNYSKHNSSFKADDSKFFYNTRKIRYLRWSKRLSL